MRRRIQVFLAGSLVAVLLLPVLNLASAPTLEGVPWRTRAFLFNVDRLTAWLARPLYEMGISLAPSQVVVGRDGWLYLGDLYQQTRSAHRQTPSDAERARMQGIAQNMMTWDQHLRRLGVRGVRFVVAPNKESVLDRYVPQWAAAATPNATDAFMAVVDHRLYADLRPVLRQRQTQLSEPLYYRTDTHWNLLGAGEGFRAFAAHLAPDAPELRWPAVSRYELASTNKRQGGDLARFLRLAGQLDDREPIPRLVAERDAVQLLDWNTKRVLYEGPNDQVLVSDQPLLVRNPRALNPIRVLWVHDSFGTAMSLPMTETFGEVLHLNWMDAMKTGQPIDSLTRSWQPDYVVFTIVERSVRDALFLVPPPNAR